MAFQFVPNADGSFTEGDKQTNPETNQEYIFTDGAWRPLGIEVATDLTELDARYLKLSGGTLTNSLAFNRGNKSTHQFGIEPNSSTSDTNIYVFSDGQMRLRSTHTDSISDRVGSHIVLDPNGGLPETKIYHVVTPTDDSMATNKKYVDEQAANLISKTGAQELTTGTWRIQQTSETKGISNYIVVQDDLLKLYHVQDPTSSEHAANKKYVDDKVDALANGSVPTNNALQIQINDINNKLIPSEIFQEVFQDVDDEIKDLKRTDDLIKTDLTTLTIENVNQNAQIQSLIARIEALENP